MIILIPREYYVEVECRSLNDLEIEDRNLDYNINLYREPVTTEMELDDEYKPILDQEQIYRRDFLNEIDNEYAKNAVAKKQNIG